MGLALIIIPATMALIVIPASDVRSQGFQP
jgi:hypothetical protein